MNSMKRTDGTQRESQSPKHCDQRCYSVFNNPHKAERFPPSRNGHVETLKQKRLPLRLAVQRNARLRANWQDSLIRMSHWT